MNCLDTAVTALSLASRAAPNSRRRPAADRRARGRRGRDRAAARSAGGARRPDASRVDADATELGRARARPARAPPPASAQVLRGAEGAADAARRRAAPPAPPRRAPAQDPRARVAVRPRAPRGPRVQPPRAPATRPAAGSGRPDRTSKRAVSVASRSMWRTFGRVASLCRALSVERGDTPSKRRRAGALANVVAACAFTVAVFAVVGARAGPRARAAGGGGGAAGRRAAATRAGGPPGAGRHAALPRPPLLLHRRELPAGRRPRRRRLRGLRPRRELWPAARPARRLRRRRGRVRRGAAKESEIPNFKGSYLGRFPLVSADFWTGDHLSERSRSADAFPGTRARGTLTLKRR